MKKILLWITGILAALLAIIYAGGSWYFSTILIASPTKQVTPKEITEAQEVLVPANIPLPAEVSIPSIDDVTLAGYFYENPDPADCGIVLLHGYTSLAYDLTAWVPMFWELGCHVLGYDARGHGNSSDVYHTFGYHERNDVSAAVDWLANQAALPPSSIGMFGISYGAAGVLQSLAVRSDVAFIIADSAYEDYETIIRYQASQQYGALLQPLVPGAITTAEWRADFDMNEIAANETIRNNEVPVLLIHALEDNYTFASHSESIYANANQENTVLALTDWGNGHGGSQSTRPDEYQEIVYEFLADYAPQYGRQ